MAKKPRVSIYPPKFPLTSESPTIPLMPLWTPVLVQMALWTGIALAVLYVQPVWEICYQPPLLPVEFNNKLCLRNRQIALAQSKTVTPTVTLTPTSTPEPFTPTGTPSPTIWKHSATPTPAIIVVTATPPPATIPPPETIPPAPLATSPPVPTPIPLPSKTPLQIDLQMLDVPSTVVLPTLEGPPVPKLPPVTVKILTALTGTATPIPTPTRFWTAWHVVNIDVRDVPDRRDGSSAVYHYLLDANDMITSSLDIKMRMSNGTEDLRVNEADSQKTIFEDGVSSYFFHIGQGGAVWDCQLYRRDEQQGIDISELLKLPVGQNQEIRVYWEYGPTPLIEPMPAPVGPGVDNGRSAPVNVPQPPPAPAVKETVIVVVTATPATPPTATPWIIILPTYTPQPTYTPFPSPTWTTLSPMSESAASLDAHRARIYMPVILKYTRW